MNEREEFCYYQNELRINGREIADVIGVNEATIYRYRAGAKIPTVVLRFLYLLNEEKDAERRNQYIRKFMNDSTNSLINEIRRKR